jgi:hypothetical protein
MSRILPKTAILAVVAAIVLLASVPAAAALDPACLAVSDALPPPDYFERCSTGRAAAPAPAPSGFVPGDLAYLQRLTPAPQTLMTAPLPTYTFTTIGPNSMATFAMDFDNTATILYGIDNVSRQLGTFNLNTGAFTAIAPVQGIPAGLNVRGLRFDPTSTSVYLLFGANLYTIDIATGATVLLGVTTGTMIDIAIDNSGQMYGMDIVSDTLHRIDKTNGSSVVVGPTGINANFAQGMDFDASDNTLYGFAFVITPAQQGHLVRYNLTTGAATILATSPEELEGAIKVSTTQDLEAAALSVDAAGNGVLQPNETAVVVAPSWRNPNGAATANVTGVLSNFTGPTGPTYTIVDSAASYGTIAANATQQCTDCYAVTAAAASRPATHWDATADETLTPATPVMTWTLHVGDSFTDVPAANAFYRFIETIVHRSVTGGCTATSYCPIASTTREQMAVFVLVSKEGPAYSPPACGAVTIFADVPSSSPFCRWVEELARRGVVSGCGGGNYCPTASATREQMSVFVLRTLDPALNPPACTTPMFADVPASSPFCRWIEELARRGVVTGCGGGNYCPTADVTREQMSVFLSVTFGLTLYGVI